MIKVTEEIRNVLNFNFSTQQELTLSTLRMEESTENDFFIGRPFTLQEYIDWEIIRKGKFTYLDEFDGINIPGNALLPFFAGDYNPLSLLENRFLDSVLPESGRINSIYIMGTHGRRNRVHIHEEAHGLYYIDKEYKHKADEIVSSLNKRQTGILERYLIKNCYGKHTWPDEKHAYLADGDYDFKQSKQMIKLFKHHRKLNLK